MEKIICIVGYNTYMKGTDKVDQCLAYYSLLRKAKSDPNFTPNTECKIEKASA
jgi:hypothetical protein